MLMRLTYLFPLWALVGSVFAMLYPELFIPLKSLIVPLLVVVMLAMGLTLRMDNFTNLASQRKAITIGVLLQFSVMPVGAFLIASALNLDRQLLVGMVIVGSVAGGTASNVICYLAKGDVALSIAMTSLSTLIGVLATPLLIKLLVGYHVDIPVTGMVISLVKIVLLPVSVGMFINHFWGRKLEAISRFLPLVSMLAIVFIIAIIVALNHHQLHQIGWIVIIAVMLHNGLGLLLGYVCCYLCGFDEKTCRTVAIEVGMQNSGLATALAIKFFTPLATVPAAIFSVWHNISGALLAGFWLNRDARKR